jgi:hypothetical protein
MSTELKLSLPDNLAREAEASGLLTPGAIEALLREEIRRRRVNQLFSAADRLANLDVPPLTRGNPRRIFDAARAGNINLFTTVTLLVELEDVLGRQKFAGRLSSGRVTPHDLVLGYAALATVIEPAEIEPVVLAYKDIRIVSAAELIAEI